MVEETLMADEPVIRAREIDMAGCLWRPRGGRATPNHKLS